MKLVIEIDLDHAGMKPMARNGLEYVLRCISDEVDLVDVETPHPIRVDGWPTSAGTWMVTDSGLAVEDVEAMDLIHGVLDGQEWHAGTIEDVAAVVVRSGRTISGPEAERGPFVMPSGMMVLDDGVEVTPIRKPMDGYVMRVDQIRKVPPVIDGDEHDPSEMEFVIEKGVLWAPTDGPGMERVADLHGLRTTLVADWLTLGCRVIGLTKWIEDVTTE